jgi:hypothetical protein
MRFHLVTVDGAQQFGETWVIAPLVTLRSLMERGPTLMMPMAGEEIEFRLPDGQVMKGHIGSFGIDVWKDSDGNLDTDTDPSNPSLTLTITCASDVEDVPVGTEIWLSNARSKSATQTT